MRKKLLIMFTAMAAMLLFIPGAYAADIIASGKYDSYTTWSLDSEGTITFYGEGPMAYAGTAKPYDEYKSMIKKAVFVDNGNGYYGECYIGQYAFQNCTNLEEIDFGWDVDRIQMYAFDGCTNLKTINWNDNTFVNIHSYAFRNCTSLTEINLPNGIDFSDRIIGISGYTNQKGIFEGCTNLETVVLSDNVTAIPEYAFANCEKLKNINISDKLTYLGTGAFNGCKSLEELTLPASFEGSFSASDCTSLKKLTFLRGV